MRLRHSPASKFKEFNKAVAAIQNARKQINGELDNARKDQRFDWLFKAGSQEIVALARTAFPLVNAVPGIDTVSGAAQQGLELGAKYGVEQVEQLSRRLRDKLHTDTALDYVAPELKLGMSLGKDLAQFAKDLPLLIFIDTYELADEGDPLLRIVMGAAGARVGWVIAGRDNLWAGRDFYMRSSTLTNITGYKDIVEFGFAVDFNAGGVGAFTIADIIDYFTLLYKNVSTLPDTYALHLPPTIGEAEAGRILDVTEGVPLAVQIAAGIYLETGDLNIVTRQDDARQAIVDRMVQRYLQHVQDDPADRARLYGLALLRRPDTHQTDAIAAALGLSEEQSNYNNELTRLHRRYSFIFSEKTQTLLHKEVRDFLRQSLLERRNDPDIKEINQRLWNAHKTSLMMLEEKRKYNDLRERLEEIEWVGVYLDLANYQEVLDLDPDNTYAYSMRGSIYLYLKNREQARINFYRVSELDPTNINYAWMAEWACMGQERPDPALATRLEAIANIDSTPYVRLVCQGVAYGLRGMLKEGVAQLAQAITLKADEWDAYFWQVMIYAYLGRYTTASEFLDKVKALVELDMPPVLLTPLYWLEHDRLDFFREYARPLLEKYSI